MLLSSSLAHLLPGGTAATRVRIAYDHQGFWPVRKSSSVLCTQGAPVSLSKLSLDRETVTVHHQFLPTSVFFPICVTTRIQPFMEGVNGDRSGASYCSLRTRCVARALTTCPGRQCHC